jgi:hypothetical protein
MAIAVVYRPPALSAEQYKASWAGGSPMPDPQGLLFHAGVGEGDECAPDPAGAPHHRPRSERLTRPSAEGGAGARHLCVRSPRR